MDNGEKRQEILLESGTNEIEIMEFTIAGNTFGINVAKVREIMMHANVKPMPHAHPAVEGVFKPRELVITVVNLPYYLGIDNSERTDDKDLFIITNFNNLHIAFHVHTVEGIARFSWEQIEKPDATIYGGDEGIITGITEYDGRIITILDFEKIIADIAPETSIQISEIDDLGERSQTDVPIVIAEDSALLSKMIVDSLHKAGYNNTTKFDNGLEAWEYLAELGDQGSVDERVACIITDIEMPKMDGHRLTKLVKENSQLKHVPLIIFSSLISDEMRLKGESLGADAQLTKPEIGRLVTLMDSLIANSR